MDNPNLDEKDFPVQLTWALGENTWTETVAVRDHEEFRRLRACVAQGEAFNGRYCAFPARGAKHSMGPCVILATATEVKKLALDYDRWSKLVELRVIK